MGIGPASEPFSEKRSQPSTNRNNAFQSNHEKKPLQPVLPAETCAREIRPDFSIVRKAFSTPAIFYRVPLPERPTSNRRLTALIYPVGYCCFRGEIPMSRSETDPFAAGCLKMSNSTSAPSQ